LCVNTGATGGERDFWNDSGGDFGGGGSGGGDDAEDDCGRSAPIDTLHC